MNILNKSAKYKFKIFHIKLIINYKKEFILNQISHKVKKILAPRF